MRPYFLQMSIKEIINNIFGGFQKYIDTEKEIIRLKVVKELSRMLGLIFSTIFIIMMFHLCMLLLGIWLGFLLSGLFDNYMIGFGVTTGIYAIWLAISIKYRKPLLIKPFTDLMISSITEREKRKNASNKEDEQPGA